MIKRRSVFVACLLSILQAGLGLLYVGKPCSAVAIPAGAILLLLLARVSGLVFLRWGMMVLFLLLFVAWLGCIVWSGIAAKKAGEITLSRFHRWYVYVAYGVAVAFLIQVAVKHKAQWFGYETFRLPSASMADTLLAGDYIIDDGWAYRANRQPKRGDVVICAFSANPAVSYVRRVVGIPGEVISMRDGQLLIDGVQLSEPYIVPEHNTQAAAMSFSFRVPPDYCFVLGDNRDRSYDSRYVGPVRQTDIAGQVRSVWFSYDSKDGGRVNRIGLLVR